MCAPKSGKTMEKKIDPEQMQSLMRVYPSLQDTADFFKCTTRTIERFIRKKFKLTFVAFREQNMIHTRLSIKRKMIEKAQAGDNTMLIWCSKNLLGWSDKVEQKQINSYEKLSDEEILKLANEQLSKKG